MSERLGVRLSDELRERLLGFAQARGVDYSTVIREALERYLDDVSAAREVSTPLPADTPPAQDHTLDDCVSTVGEPQLSVTSDPCACCGASDCGCADELWCLRCTRCYVHCPHGRPNGARGPGQSRRS